jgi:hypothetical protein
MIIWSGLGYLVVVIGFGTLLLTELVSEKITGDDQFYQRHGWVVLVGMLVAAALTHGLHRVLLRQRERVLIDKQTGQEVVLRTDHSLFFIPVKWWPLVFAAIGVGFAVAGGAS